MRFDPSPEICSQTSPSSTSHWAHAVQQRWCIELRLHQMLKKSPSVVLRWRTGRQVRRAHCSQRHSPTRRNAGRRHALWPALRLHEPLRAGAARRAHLHRDGHPFQEPLAGTLKIACHFLTTPHTHTLPAMPKHTPSHLSLTHAQTACTHLRASHTHPADSLRVRVLLPASDCV